MTGVGVPAITIEGLGKRYVISRRPGARTLMEKAAQSMRSAGRRRPREDFWALRDLSLEIDEGEVLGVVGRNGAGKSTLLKILAGITEPTEGQAVVHGRVGALLEVGTGFHPELSGRDNVYLNGAILGMRRADIARKYDQIVEFAEIESFIDVPVKRYSSGMYVRLAFAVAAHLEPEVLLVDEVLSVGDQAFQEKCLGRIHEVTRSGRTVIFVSHNLASLVKLCDRGVLLDRGRLVSTGTIQETLDEYLATRPGVRQAGELSDVQRTGTGAVRFRSVEVSGPHGASNVYAGGPVEFRLRFAADRPVSGRQLRISVGINSILGDRLITLLTSWDPQSTISGGTIADGTAVRCAVPELPLRPGKYLLTLYVDQAGEHLDVVDGQIELEVLPSDYFGAGSLPSETQGPFLVRHRWRLETEAGEAGTDRLVGDRA